MLSLVLPTYNEAQNIRVLLPAIAGALQGIPHEIIVVDDDSPDGTWNVAQELSKKISYVRVVRRRGKKGLSSAVVDGFLMADGDVLAVMDSDGQHDPKLLPALYQAVKDGAGIAVASRYREGGSVSQWKGVRLWLSKTATFLARKLPPVEVSDPMSGFFAVDRQAFRAIAPSLHPRGFKILLEILAFLPPDTRTAEVPLVFGLRRAGQSKLSLKVQIAFLSQIGGILLRRLGAAAGSRKGQWALFFVTCAVIALALLPQAWRLRLLYGDAGLRAQAQSTLERVAQQQGWLLSDVALTEVTTEGFRVTYRPHVRGEDETHCYRLKFRSSTLTPCEGR